MKFLLENTECFQGEKVTLIFIPENAGTHCYRLGKRKNAANQRVSCKKEYKYKGSASIVG